MARPKRKTKGGYFYHVLNRANGRLRIFKKRDDFLAFEKIIGEIQERVTVDVFGYCLMGNHWHLLLRPHRDGDLSEFMRLVSVTHATRYHHSHGTAGTGHLYQGRFKSFPVQGNNHLLNVLRYIESNPLRAQMVEKASDYKWSSYCYHSNQEDRERAFTLSSLPTKLPSNWSSQVHKDMAKSKVDEIANSIKRGAGFGDKDWVKETVVDLDLQSTINKRGRPKKDSVPLV